MPSSYVQSTVGLFFPDSVDDEMLKVLLASLVSVQTVLEVIYSDYY